MSKDSFTDLQQCKQDRAQAKEELAQAQEGLQRQAYFTAIYLRARDSNGLVLKQCQANEALIEDAHMHVEFFCGAVKQDSFARQFIWEIPPAAKSDKKAEERDRAAFTAFAKQNRYGEGIANFNLAREVLGYGQVTERGLIEAVQTCRLRLAPASAEELEERETERIDQEQLRLRNTPSHLLKPEAAQTMVDARRQAQVEEADRAFAAKQEAEAGTNYPPLPEFLPEFLAKRFGNQRLDRSFLMKKADRAAFKFLHQKFGVVAVEERLRGIR